MISDSAAARNNWAYKKLLLDSFTYILGLHLDRINWAVFMNSYHWFLFPHIEKHEQIGLEFTV